MSRWYSPEDDPFVKVGKIRLIIVRHNPELSFNGKKENCIHIVQTDTFTDGFLCPEISKSRYGSGPSIGWIADAVDSDCEHKINHLFKSKKNGIYEMVGEVFHWSSRDYWGEWDGDTEVRNHSIQEISFNHAMYFECETIKDELTRLIPVQADYDRFRTDWDIHHYMTKNQILTNHANVLNYIIDNRGSFYSRTTVSDMKNEELENLIHMLMLQIDSESSLKDKREQALEIDGMVQDVIKQHHKLMDPEYE